MLRLLELDSLAVKAQDRHLPQSAIFFHFALIWAEGNHDAQDCSTMPRTQIPKALVRQKMICENVSNEAVSCCIVARFDTAL